MDDELKIYMVNFKYVRNLINVEKRLNPNKKEIPILKNNPQENKQGRPYLGIVIVANGRDYCIPFCSLDEKPKFETMSENITMRKMRDENGDVIGILNINNMIPVRKEYLEEIDIKIYPEDSDNHKLLANKTKLQKELNWCKEHKCKKQVKTYIFRQLISSTFRQSKTSTFITAYISRGLLPGFSIAIFS